MGILGQPKYKWEEPVTFKYVLNDVEKTFDGVIRIVDAYGTFEQKDEPSYDIEALYNGD